MPVPQHGPVTRAITAMRTEPTPPRRGFLRGLLTLPLIGGGVTLIGAPSAVAEPVTRHLLERYSEWLRIERNSVHDELFPDSDPEMRPVSAMWFRQGPKSEFHIPRAPAAWNNPTPASTRAALVLSAVGADWRA